MNEQYQIGDFVEVEFILRSGKRKNWFHIFATLTDIDRYYIELTDNHGQEYLVQKRDIKFYEKQENKNQTLIAD